MQRRNDPEGDWEHLGYKSTFLSPNNKRSKQTAMQSQTWMPTISSNVSPFSFPKSAYPQFF